MAFLVLAALAAWGLYMWWRRREHQHALLESEVPEPWAPPAEPEPPAPEHPVDEEPSPLRSEPETATAFGESEPDVAVTEPVAADEETEETGETEQWEPAPVGESAGIPSGARPLGGNASAHHERPRRATVRPSPLPDGNVVPPVRRPSMPSSGWEPPFGG